MLGLGEGRAAIERDVGVDIRYLEELDASDWDRPTRLEGWTVRDLARHLVYGQELQAEGWERLGSEGGAQEPSIIAAEDPESILAALRQAHDRFAGLLDSVGDADLGQPCPLPYGTLPAAVVLQVAVMEAGVHRSDLEHAVDRGGLDLEPDTLEAIFTLLPGTLPQLAMVATERPAVGTGVRLVALDGNEVALRVGDAGWEPTDGAGGWAYVVEGDPSAVALFALGRIPHDHPALSVEGDAELAGRFKVHFPGP